MYLERHDDKDNMHRFYQMIVTPCLFDDWSPSQGMVYYGARNEGEIDSYRRYVK
jgi:predicted DNA-binding WGR domain protein